MANLTFTTTQWGTSFIRSPNQIARDISNSFESSINYLDGLEQISEELAPTLYRAQFDNGGSLTVAGTGFDGSLWSIQTMSYAEPANRVAFQFSGDLRFSTNSEYFAGSFSNIQTKLTDLEISAEGKWNIDSSGAGSGWVRNITYEQSGETLKIEDGSISYNRYQASGRLGTVTVISAQGHSLAITDTSKLTAPFLDGLQGRSWAYFFSADFLNGNDRLVAGGMNDDFGGFAGNDRLFGKGGNDTLRGGTGNDSIYGDIGRDALRGDSGDDVLNGGPGGDAMTGGNGDDLYYVDDVADWVVETDSSLVTGGKDSVYSELSAYTLPAHTEIVRLLSTGTANATGNGLSNILYAGAGNNVLDGRAGRDTVSYADAGSGVAVSLADTGTQATGGSGSDRLIGIENLAGTRFNDELVGNGGDNLLRGKGGNDRLVGGDGNDTLDGGAGVDTMLGSAGHDTYAVDSLADVVWESRLAGAGSDTLRFDFAGTSAVTVSLGGTVASLTVGKTYANIENLSLGGTAAHNGIGSPANNLVVGNAAANKLFGLGGSDTLIGGAGADTLVGGSGNDRFVLSSAARSDTLGDFTSGSDRLAISQAGIRIGDGDTTPSSTTVEGPGGFSNRTELVVVTGNIAGAITATTAAAKIGAAGSAYTVGRTALFAVDNGADSSLFRFTAANADATVSAGELELLATLIGTGSTAVSDYLFIGV